MNPAAERIVSLYERHADAWDKLRGDSGDNLFEKIWIDRFLGPLQPGSSILDLGCGSGRPISGYLTRKGSKVSGVDSSPSLIAKCRSRFPDHDWTVADMRTLRLGRRFDGILAWDSFFHLSPEDQPGMFPVFADHAAPNALLMFTSGPVHGEVISTFENEPLYHGSLDEAEYRLLIDQNGFEVLSYVAEDRACGFHTIWLARRR